MNKFFTFLCALLLSANLFSQSDNCSSATVLTPGVACTPTSGTTLGATQSIAGCVGTADDDVWYTFTATGTSHTINVVGSATFDAVVQLFSGTCSTLNTVSCMDNTAAGGTETIYATGLTVGAVYTIRVYHYFAGSGGSTFTICVSNPPPVPANNTCAGAISLPVNAACITTAGTTLGATASYTGCSGTADDDVFYSFIATNSVQTITVDPSVNMDAVVELYSGTCGTSTNLYCADAGFTDGNEVISAVGLIPGNIYYIRVYDYYSSNGGFPFTICVTGPATSAPTNDDPCGAIAIPPVTSACNFLNFTSIGATTTTTPGTPSSTCVNWNNGSGTYGAPSSGGFAAGTKDVWFKITVPSTGNLTITIKPGLAAPVNDMVFALYTGACGSLTQIACSDDYNYPSSPNDLQPFLNQTGLTPGTDVYLRVWCFGTTNSGNFALCVSTNINDACANALYICDLNGYSASTSAAFTSDRPGTGAGQMYANNETTAGVNQPDGTNTGGPFGYYPPSNIAGPYSSPAIDVTIDNNSWIRFTAASTTAVLNVTVGDCFVGGYPSGGIQMQIFSATACNNFTPVSNFRENSTGFTITGTGLVVGQDYYLMVDGYGGDICNYTISANSGVQFPAITATANPICAGGSTTLTAPTATSYEWFPGGQTTQSIVVSPSATETFTCVVGGVCGYKQTLTKTITVNQLPVMTSSASPAAICSGNSANVALTANPTSTFSWIAASNANVTGESTVAQTGATINNTLTVTTTNQESVVYTVTPTSTSGSCVGSPQTVTVTVNPRPSMTSATTASVCSGTALSLGLTSNIASTYSWVATNNTNTTGESTSAQNTSTITDAITNNSTTAQVVNYNITPTSTGGSCAGTSQAVAVTVNPTPVMTSLNTANVCSGNALNIILTSGAAATYTWIASDNSNTTGESLTTQSTSTINNTITNSTSSSQVVSYSVTPTGTAGSCVGAAQTVNVTVNPLPVMTSANSTSICSGNALSFNLTSNPTAVYTWLAVNNTNTTGESTTPQLGTIINNTITNSNTVPENVVYTITPVTSLGCTGAAQSFTVTVNPAPIMTSSNTATICSGNALNIALTSSASATYSWVALNNANTTGESTSAQNTANINDNIVNTSASSQVVTYSVTPTGTSGTCSGPAQTVNVTVDPTPIMTSASSQTLCSGNAVNIPLTSTVGATYTWVASSNTNVTGESLTSQSSTVINDNLTNNTTAAQTINYSVTPTGTIGSCVGSPQSVTVTLNALPSLTTSPTVTPSNCGQSTGALTGAVASGAGILNYSWTNSSNVVVGTTANLSNQPAGTYNLTVTDNNCTQTFGPFSITNPGAPTAPLVAANDTILCVGQSLSLSASSSATSPTFNWTGPASSSSTSTLNIGAVALTDDGFYTVTVTSNNCTSPGKTIRVIVNPNPTANATSSNPVYCSGNSINLLGSGGGTYAWTGPNSFSSNAQNPSITNSTSTMSGTYSLTVTDANGCVNSTTTAITVNDTPTLSNVSAAANNVCEGNSITLNASSSTATSYAWTGPNSFTLSNQNPTITGSTVTMTGTYTVVATVNNCSSAPGTVNVTVNPNPSASASATATTVCSGNQIDLTALGGGNYSWTGPNSFTSNIQNPNITNSTTNMSGTYTVTVTDANQCTDVASVSILVNQTPSQPVLASNPSTLCEGDNLILNATSVGATSYSWTGPNSYNSSNQNNTLTNVTVNQTGTYTVTASANGCVSAATPVTITINSTPVANASISANTICSGNTVNLTASGGTDYSWTGPNGYTSNQANNTINNIGVSGSGTYTLIATNNPGGCSDTTTVSIAVNQTPADAVASGASTCNGTPLVLTATGNGNIDWYDSNNTLVASNDTLLPGLLTGTSAVYTVVVTSNGCSSTPVSVTASNYNVVAGATADVYSGYPPLTVNFTNTSIGVTNTDNINWNFANGNSSTTYNAIETFNNGLDFNVILTVTENVSGCSDTAMIHIHLNNELVINIPNIFTPNGDNNNDVFYIDLKGAKKADGLIYNRWGQLVHSWDALNVSWDGKLENGEQISDGTYFYIITVVDFTDTETKYPGHVSIIR